MPDSVLADTHALVWYLTVPSRLSARATGALDRAGETGGVVCFSVITLVEITYLVERHRLPPNTLDVVEAAQLGPDSPLVPIPVTLEVTRALLDIPRAVVPDMPDRIIAATALHLGLPLVTCDERIRRLAIPTVW